MPSHDQRMPSREQLRALVLPSSVQHSSGHWLTDKLCAAAAAAAAAAVAAGCFEPGCLAASFRPVFSLCGREEDASLQCMYPPSSASSCVPCRAMNPVQAAGPHDPAATVYQGPSQPSSSLLAVAGSSAWAC